MVYDCDGRIDIGAAIDAERSSAVARRKDDHDSADGEGHSRRVVEVAEMLVVPFWFIICSEPPRSVVASALQSSQHRDFLCRPRLELSERTIVS